MKKYTRGGREQFMEPPIQQQSSENDIDVDKKPKNGILCLIFRVLPWNNYNTNQMESPDKNNRHDMVGNLPFYSRNGVDEHTEAVAAVAAALQEDNDDNSTIIVNKNLEIFFISLITASVVTLGILLIILFQR
jgi:hypothetical protein